MFGITKRERVGGRDDRWLGSRHGVENARTVTLKTDGFDALEDGIVPSGWPSNWTRTAMRSTGLARTRLPASCWTTFQCARVTPRHLLDHGRINAVSAGGRVYGPVESRRVRVRQRRQGIGDRNATLD